MAERMRRYRVTSPMIDFLKLRTALVAAALAVAYLAAASGPANAALDHSTVEKTFTVAECGEIFDMAIDETNQYVYVQCRNIGGGGIPGIKRYDFNGNPAPFAATADYIVGNEIRESPTGGGTCSSSCLGTGGIAVDNSLAHPGFLYIGGGTGIGQNLDVVNPSGSFVISFPTSTPFSFGWSDVDVGPDGAIYAMEQRGSPYVAKRTPDFTEVSRLYTLEAANRLRADSTGAIWAINQSGPRLSKYEADQFSSKIDTGFATPQSVLLSLKAVPSPFFLDPLLQGSSLRSIDVDPTNDDLYVDRGNKVEVFSHGTAAEAPYQNGPTFGGGTLTNSGAMVVTANRKVFASNGTSVIRFGTGNILPDVHTFAPDTSEVGHTTATVKGVVEPAGGAGVTACQVEYGFDKTYSGPGSGTSVCSPNPASAPPGSNFTVTTPVSAALSGLETGKRYHFRFKATNPSGSNYGIDRTVVPSFVLNVQTLPVSAVSDEGATLHGSFDPDGIATTFHFEYGLDSNYGLSTPETSAGAASGVKAVEAPVDSLVPGRLWHYRVVATNGNGTTTGPDRTFRTAAPPDLSGVRTSDVAATSAKLRARINPNGYDTEYRFEYGTTTDYGQSIPLLEASVGNGTSPTDVEQAVTGLEAGQTYHFRLIAHNEWGTSESDDTTFDFAPPGCPNDHVRQQTSSSYLPDCRAYELVSPGSAGGVILMPGEMLIAFAGHDEGEPRHEWPQNTGYATSPPRFSYWGALGAVNGIDAVASLLEQYVTTRTPNGWITTLPGLKGSESREVGRTQCNEALSLCLNHDEGVFAGLEPPEEAAPVFDVSGEQIDHWPTNVGTVFGGRYFSGAQRASRDFSHYVFGSNNAVFTPEGLKGGLGSAYDNDIRTRNISIISKLPNGNDMTQDGADAPTQRFDFPGMSVDGSRILIQHPASEGGVHLYVRVNDALTYDVSRGAGADFVGMVRDGQKVLFTTAAPLTLDDTDTSTDLYQWSEAGDVLTRLSQGNGQGNTDSCTSAFSPKCGVQGLDTEQDHPLGYVSIPGPDDDIAEGSGDAYFYSPEVLDASRPGIAGQKNLYVYRNGTVRLVSVMDQGTKISRMQISPDGSHAAMITTSRMTSYDNKGIKEMYTFNPETSVVRCASCDPNGFPPISPVEASSNGRFMSDDGRAFFATRDALVPRDTNGAILDVYEYVGGRPQLITSGIGSRDFTGGGKTISLLFPGVNIGLEAVSHDGVDVYFSTFETLVTQDQNGAFVKFYDARTGGGFTDDDALLPCAAADECHGADSSRPPAPGIGTGGDLGAGGNAVSASANCGSRKKKRKSRRCTKKTATAGRTACRKRRLPSHTCVKPYQAPVDQRRGK
jgi:hypothetical protein